jgi:4-carboxymuconolactone decarboxylase
MHRRGASVFLGGIAWIWAACALAQAPPGPRIAPLPESEWTDEVRAVAATFEPVGMPNLVATYARHPVAAQALLPHLQYIWESSTLPPRHRALLSLRTLWLTRSEYLWAHRAERALEEGLTRADLERVARGPDAPGWDPFEALVIRAGDELVVDAFISDATWNALDAEYDIPQLIDTIDTGGALTMHAGAANSLGVAIEPGVTQRFPDVPYAVAAERTNIRLVDKAPRIGPQAPAGQAISANVFNTFRHNPAADQVRGAINTHVTGRATIDPLHREFLLVRIGTLCRSEYEYAAHVRVGRRAGMTDADLALILADAEDRESDDPIKLAMLAATDELWADYRIADATWAELAASQSTEQMIDVLVSVGGYRSTSMLINSAGVQLDDNMTDFRFPPELR